MAVALEKPDYYAGLRSYQIADVLNAPADAWNFYYFCRGGKTRTAGRCILRWTFDLGLNVHLIVGPLAPLQIAWTREMKKIGFDTPSNGGGSIGYLIPLLEPPSRSLSKQFITRTRTKRAKGPDGEVITEDTNDPSKVAWAGKILRDLIDGAAQGRPVVILLNDDLLRFTGKFGVRGGMKSIADLLCDLKPDTLTRDEADRDSNAGSTRSAALRIIARYTKKRRALTGTPDPNGYVNLFSQFAILDPDIFGTNKKRFQDRYVVYRDLYRREIMCYQNEEELMAKVRSVSSIIRAEDYFDVPPVEAITRHIELSVGVRAMYKELKTTGVLETEQFNIDATHQLAKLTRLSQLALGYLPVDDPDEEPIAWLHDDKIKSVVADCSEPLASGQKIVVSYRWKPEGERVAAALRKKFGQRVVHELNGRTTGDRRAIVAPFDIDEDVVSDARIMVAQEVAGGVGVSFGRADHLHFLSWSMDWGDVHQMSQRTLVPELPKFRTETYHVADRTIDVYSRNIIKRKANATVMLRATGFAAAADGIIDGAV